MYTKTTTVQALNTPLIHKLKTGDSWVKYFKEIPETISVDSPLFQQLWDLHPQEKQDVKMFGKTFKTPRFHKSFGRDYKFSGVVHKAVPVENEYLQTLLNWVVEHSGLKYDSMLINWYEDGQHYIGPHSDNEKEIVQGSPIYSFSFGQERVFRIDSKKKNEKERLDLTLNNNSLVIMGGQMQKHYKHSVPKRAKSRCPKPRINITFRLFKK